MEWAGGVGRDQLAEMAWETLRQARPNALPPAVLAHCCIRIGNAFSGCSWALRGPYWASLLIWPVPFWDCSCLLPASSRAHACFPLPPALRARCSLPPCALAAPSRPARSLLPPRPARSLLPPCPLRSLLPPAHCALLPFAASAPSRPARSPLFPVLRAHRFHPHTAHRFSHSRSQEGLPEGMRIETGALQVCDSRLIYLIH